MAPSVKCGKLPLLPPNFQCFIQVFVSKGKKAECIPFLLPSLPYPGIYLPLYIFLSCPSSMQLGSLGSAVRSPSGSARSQADKRISVHFEVNTGTSSRSCRTRNGRNSFLVARWSPPQAAACRIRRRRCCCGYCCWCCCIANLVIKN